MAWGASATSLGGHASSAAAGPTFTGAAFTTPTAGRLLYCVLAINQNGSTVTGFTPPTGWTAQRTLNVTGTDYVVLLMRIADGTEGTALTSSWTGNSQWTVGDVWQETGNPSSLTSIEETAFYGTASGTATVNYPVAAAAANTDSDELALAIFSSVSGATFTAWGTQDGFTELEDRVSAGTATSAVGFTLARKVLNATETPNISITKSNNTREYANLIAAFKPAASAVPRLIGYYTQ